jgi:hypothetical protein
MAVVLSDRMDWDHPCSYTQSENTGTFSKWSFVFVVVQFDNKLWWNCYKGLFDRKDF